MPNYEERLEKFIRSENKELYGTEDGHGFIPDDYSNKCAACGKKHKDKSSKKKNK